MDYPTTGHVVTSVSGLIAKKGISKTIINPHRFHNLFPTAVNTKRILQKCPKADSVGKSVHNLFHR